MPEIEAYFAKRPEISVAYVGFEAAPHVDFVLARGDRGSLRNLLTFFADRSQAAGPKGES